MSVGLSGILSNILDAYWLDDVRAGNVADARQAAWEQYGENANTLLERYPINRQDPSIVSNIVAGGGQPLPQIRAPDMSVPDIVPTQPLPVAEVRDIAEANNSNFEAQPYVTPQPIASPDAPINIPRLPTRGYDPIGNMTSSQIADYNTRLNMKSSPLENLVSNRFSLDRAGITGEGREKFGNTVVPYFDKSDQFRLGQVSNRGNFKEVNLPGGGAPAQPGTWVNTNKSKIRFPKYGGDPTAQVEMQIGPEKTAGHAGDVVSAQKAAALEAEYTAAEPADALNVRSNIQQFDRITSAIDGALANTDIWTSGYSALGKGLYSSDARKLSKDIALIQSNLTLSTVAAMKEASATGAHGLGPISEIEFKTLQDNIVLLDQGGKPEDLRKALKGAKKFFTDRNANIERMYIDKHGPERYDELLKWKSREELAAERKIQYKLKPGMDPTEESSYEVVK